MFRAYFRWLPDSIPDMTSKKNRIGQLSNLTLMTCQMGLFLMCFAGCASSPTRFYTLSPMEQSQPASNDSQLTARIIVAIGPVAIPDYMNRPQIVTRPGRNKAMVNEFDRWSGSLEADISRVLIENLSTLLPVDRFHVTRWAPSMQSDLQIAYRVTIDVIRIELSAVGPVCLRAQWSVINEETKSMVLVRDADITESTSGRDFEGMVASFSRALATLSRDITEAIGDLHADEE